MILDLTDDELAALAAQGLRPTARLGPPETRAVNLRRGFAAAMGGVVDRPLHSNGAFVPLVAVLIIGAVLRWAGAGFRK